MPVARAQFYLLRFSLKKGDPATVETRFPDLRDRKANSCGAPIVCMACCPHGSLRFDLTSILALAHEDVKPSA